MKCSGHGRLNMAEVAQSRASSMVRKSIALGTSSLSSYFPAIFSLPPTTKSKSLFVITANLYAASSRGWADICSRNDDFVGAIADHRARQRGRASPHVSDGLSVCQTGGGRADAVYPAVLFGVRLAASAKLNPSLPSRFFDRSLDST
jgi:hypothetical protein